MTGNVRIKASELLRFVSHTVASKVNKKENGSVALDVIGLLEKDSLVSLLEFFETRVYLNNSVLFVVGDPH